MVIESLTRNQKNLHWNSSDIVFLWKLSTPEHVFRRMHKTVTRWICKLVGWSVCRLVTLSCFGFYRQFWCYCSFQNTWLAFFGAAAPKTTFAWPSVPLSLQRRRPQIWPLRSQIQPLGPQIWSLRPPIQPLRPQIRPLRPWISHLSLKLALSGFKSVLYGPSILNAALSSLKLALSGLQLAFLGLTSAILDLNSAHSDPKWTLRGFKSA